MRTAKLAILAASGVPQVLGDYVWPTQQDWLEDLLAMQSGYIRFGFTDLVTPCGFGSNIVGRQTSAEWVRTAFHDFATHDKATGTGGLDASLQYEIDRPENEGSAFNNTFADMHDFITPRSSVADLTALGLVASIASCGGPKIALRAGRIDALEAGPAGVPKPDDSLNSTIEAFARTGFNVSDMIAMVACGHSLGGVHAVDFPAIVSGEAVDSNVPKFDSTTDSFDTAVVDEYLAGEGTNPLVFGHNDTTNSDRRVFGADGTNATMKALADKAAFRATCADVLERMIDTVPAGVTLSEPIELVDIKPYVNRLELDGTASNTSAPQLAFEGRIRVRTTNGTGRDTNAINVALDVQDRLGGTNRTLVPAPRARARGGTSFGFYGEEFTWFEFATTLDAGAGIKAFDIMLTHDDQSGKVDVFDNAGTGGYPVSDGLLYAQTQSCIDSNVKDGNMTVTIRAAVRGDVDKAGKVPGVRLAHRVQQQGVMLPRLAVETSEMKKSGKSEGGYVYYEVTVPIEAAGWSTVFDIVLPTEGGEIVSEFHHTNDLTSC